MGWASATNQMAHNCRRRVHTVSMFRNSVFPHAALAAAASGLVGLLLCPHVRAAGEKAPVSAEVVAACEKAARQALALPPSDRAELSFDTAPAVQANLSQGSQIVLRGAGRWRAGSGTRSFNYSCNVDPSNVEAVGVVVRNTTPVAAVAAPAPARRVDPDLSHLSPQACESKAAAALAQRWPRVAQISFDSSTRSLQQDASGRAELRGQGRALPTPNAPFTYFDFGCVIDPRDGKVLSTRVSG
jgi:hypothetical protein